MRITEENLTVLIRPLTKRWYMIAAEDKCFWGLPQGNLCYVRLAHLICSTVDGSWPLLNDRISAQGTCCKYRRWKAFLHTRRRGFHRGFSELEEDLPIHDYMESRKFLCWDHRALTQSRAVGNVSFLGRSVNSTFIQLIYVSSLWNAWTDGYQAYFSPFHLLVNTHVCVSWLLLTNNSRPTVRSEYAKFFAKSTEDKLNTPLSSLAVFLMVCALGRLLSLVFAYEMYKLWNGSAGSLLRATAAEILGHPDPEVTVNARSKGEVPRDLKDLTSSRLQSELYCTFDFASSSASRIT